MSDLLPKFNTPAVVDGVCVPQSEEGIAGLEPRVNAEGNVVIGGSVTSGDVLYARVTSPALGQFTEDGSNHVQVSVTATGDDTTATLAASLFALLRDSLPLAELGLEFQLDGSEIDFTQAGPAGNLTIVSLWALGSNTLTATVSGNAHVGDRLWLRFTSDLLDAPELVHYDVVDGNDDCSMAGGLRTAINANENLASIGVTATHSGAVICLHIPSEAEVVLVEEFVTGKSVVVGGSITTGNKLNLVITNSNLPGGAKTVTYTCVGGDTTTTAATGLYNAVNADTDLADLGITALNPAAGRVSIIVPPAAGSTTYDKWIAGTETATIGGTHSTDDGISIRVTNANLSGGHKDVAYTVVSGDTTPTLIATHLALAIHNDADIRELGIDATGSGADVLITVPEAAGPTSFSYTLSDGATETVDLAGPGTETLTLAGPCASIHLCHQETETFTPANQALSGGSGAVIPSDDFNFVYNGQVVQLKANRRIALGTDALRALAAQGSPKIK